MSIPKPPCKNEDKYSYIMSHENNKVYCTCGLSVSLYEVRSQKDYGQHYGAEDLLIIKHQQAVIDYGVLLARHIRYKEQRTRSKSFIRKYGKRHCTMLKPAL